MGDLFERTSTIIGFTDGGEEQNHVGCTKCTQAANVCVLKVGVLAHSMEIRLPVLGMAVPNSDSLKLILF